MISQRDAKVILKDKCIDSLLEASHPKYCAPDDDSEEYLSVVYKSLKNLKAYLRKAAKAEQARKKR